jgi:hypothetical protein
MFQYVAEATKLKVDKKITFCAKTRFHAGFWILTAAYITITAFLDVTRSLVKAINVSEQFIAYIFRTHLSP